MRYDCRIANSLPYTHTHTQPQFDLTIMQDPPGSFLIPHASNQV